MEVDTTQLDALVKDLTILGSDFNEKTDQILGSFALDLHKKFTFRSPVDQGPYRADWKVDRLGLNHYSINNGRTIDYAPIMETGSAVGEKPWPSVGPKTVVKNGRIWSGQMPEPVAGGALDNADWDRLSEDLLKALLGGF